MIHGRIFFAICLNFVAIVLIAITLLITLHEVDKNRDFRLKMQPLSEGLKK